MEKIVENCRNNLSSLGTYNKSEIMANYQKTMGVLLH